MPDTDAEIARITDALRRAIRLNGLAYATEENIPPTAEIVDC